MTAAIDGCLSVRGGRLFVEDCDAAGLVAQFGTPLFVVSESQLRSNQRRFQAAFAAHWTDGPVDVLPAFKANTTLATRRVLTEEGAGADVYSAGELEGVLRTGVDPERVSVNGGGKSDALLRRCIEVGARITVEDLDEPKRIDRLASELGKRAKVRLRVKPDFPNLQRLTDFAVEFATIDIGIQTYKSGVPAQYLVDLGREVLSLPNVELVGLHLHVGRHHASLWFWRGVMERFGALVADLCSAWGGYRPQELDIGGGFACPRDPHNKLGLRRDVILTWLTYPFEQLLRLLGNRVRYAALSAIITGLLAKLPSRGRAPSIEAYAEACVTTLRRVLAKRGVETAGVRLQVEPGRAMYGDTGIHLTTVKKVKRQTSPVKMSWILTDTTCFFLTGGTLEYNFHDFRVTNRADAPKVEVADVVGHSCAADRILPFARVPRVEEGDVIALLDTGAYNEVSASNFNALPRPASVLVTGAQAAVIRRAETADDVFARDEVPRHLERVSAAAVRETAQPLERHAPVG